MGFRLQGLGFRIIIIITVVIIVMIVIIVVIIISIITALVITTALVAIVTACSQPVYRLILILFVSNPLYHAPDLTPATQIPQPLPSRPKNQNKGAYRWAI